MLCSVRTPCSRSTGQTMSRSRTISAPNRCGAVVELIAASTRGLAHSLRTSSGTVDARCPVGDGGDLGLAREHLFQQDPVYLGVRVEAAVRQDGEAVVKVRGLAQ